MDLRSVQRPLKEQYRSDPSTSPITLRAKGSETATPMACSVDIGRAVYNAEAHAGIGGTGTAACSGDLLLGALAACAQITCQMVAAATGIPTERIDVTVDGDLDLQGTLGMSKDVPVGFENIHVRFDICAPAATAEQLRGLREKTEQYLCGDADVDPTAKVANRMDPVTIGPTCAHASRLDLSMVSGADRSLLVVAEW